MRSANAVQRWSQDGVHVMVSNADTPLIRQRSTPALYGSALAHSVCSAYRNINSDGRGRGKVESVNHHHLAPVKSGQTANRTGKQPSNKASRVSVQIAGYRKATRAGALLGHARDGATDLWAASPRLGVTCYGKVRRVDFVCYHPRAKWPQCLVIQCVRRRSEGPYEKFPFEVLSIQQNEYPTIVVLDGGGYSKGAETWLKGQAGKCQLKHVYGLGEFQRFSPRGSLYGSRRI